LKVSKDGWAGLAVAAASLFLFSLTLGLKPSPLVPIGPGFYPRIVLGVTAFLGALLFAGELYRGKSGAPAAATANYRAVLTHFALFGVYAVALPWFGFRIATFAYVAAANALMAPPHNWREWLRVFLVAFGTALATYVIFERYLSVLLPRGHWTDF
jgi:putative tricarboxylic transport membrane protein